MLAAEALSEGLGVSDVASSLAELGVGSSADEGNSGHDDERQERGDDGVLNE